MCRIYSAADIEIYISRLFKKHTADKRRAIVSIAPFFIELILAYCILGIFHNTVYCDDAFRNEVYAFNLCNRRNSLIDFLLFHIVCSR